MSAGIEKVRDRRLRSTGALEQAGIEYAVIGGNAVAAWVSKVDESVVRATRDVDLLVRREDMGAITAALEGPISVIGLRPSLAGRGRAKCFSMDRERKLGMECI